MYGLYQSFSVFFLAHSVAHTRHGSLFLALFSRNHCIWVLIGCVLIRVCDFHRLAAFCTKFIGIQHFIFLLSARKWNSLTLLLSRYNTRIMHTHICVHACVSFYLLLFSAVCFAGVFTVCFLSLCSLQQQQQQQLSFHCNQSFRYTHIL